MSRALSLVNPEMSAKSNVVEMLYSTGEAKSNGGRRKDDGGKSTHARRREACTTQAWTRVRSLSSTKKNIRDTYTPPPFRLGSLACALNVHSAPIVRRARTLSPPSPLPASLTPTTSKMSLAAAYHSDFVSIFNPWSNHRLKHAVRA